MDHTRREELSRRMARLAEGDRRELRPVFDAAWPIVRRFAERSLAGGDAEDVAQQAMIKVFARAGQFDPARDALAWILAITAWEVRTQRKKSSRRREELGSVPESPAAADVSIEEVLIARELEAAAVEVLGALRPEDVEIILTATEERARPRISAAAFRKRLQRAMERLRGTWRARHGIE